MDPQAELSIVRAAYAKQILAAAGVDMRGSPAFAHPREDFVGLGPWLMLRWRATMYRRPTRIRFISIPTIWSRWCPSDESTTDNCRCTPTSYTRRCRRRRARRTCRHWHGLLHAILHISSDLGRVTGIEYDAASPREPKPIWRPMRTSSDRRRRHAVLFDADDVIYVNAGCTQPATRWLDGLADGGRLIMPMTSDQGFGGCAGAHGECRRGVPH